MFNLTISVRPHFHFHMGQMDYGYLYGIHIAIGKREWSWVRPTKKRRKWEAENG